ncbi:MAG: PepSY-associated TM helix domain-containing protein [Hyphomonadaceae bacterium]
MTRASFYRLCRNWHGYLSAFSFLALIFFAGTGVLLNHPGLLQGAPPEPREARFQLAPEELSRVKAADDPGEALAEIARAKAPVVGAYRSGDVSGNELYVNLLGARGRSDLVADLTTGETSVYVETQDTVGVLNELHRGEHAGSAWRLLIDAIAGVILLMAVAGFVLFLTMRFRLRTALVLMGASVVVMGGLFWFTTL